MDPLLTYPLILLSFCFIALSWFAGSDAPYVATKMELIKKVLIKAGLKKGKTFYELGSGDGRVVFEAAKLGGKAIGIEQSWLRVLWSKYVAFKLGLSQAYFYHGNIFKRSYQDGDVVYIYLLQHAVNRLEEKLSKELRKGSTIITQRYHFQNLKPKFKEGDFWIYQIT